MLKKITVPLIILMLLSGCTAAGQEIVLSDAAAEASEGYTDNTAEASSDTEVLEISADDNVTADDAAVYVCGAVEKPGVYELDKNSRIVDAVEAAGGFTDSADRTYVNLAAHITDGMKLQIPTKEETAAIASTLEAGSFGYEEAAPSGSEGSGLININTATKQELTALSGIGDATAEKIIRYREENGGFKKIEDIMKISGIKEKLFSKIRDDITV